MLQDCKIAVKTNSVTITIPQKASEILPYLTLVFSWVRITMQRLFLKAYIHLYLFYKFMYTDTQTIILIFNINIYFNFFQGLFH